MPIFEYHCKSCMRDFEEVVFDDTLPECPHCHSSNTEKLISRPCRTCVADGGDLAPMPPSSSSGSSSGGCAGCSGGSCATCGH